MLTSIMAGLGLYSLSNLPIGAVPDITNNQVQIITTSQNLATQDIEKFVTYPVELEMANLPGVKEIRSISKFGLSVVTVVFEDELGTYLPRQLISEKLKSAAERIPEGFGTPSMGPITTGLGEIYQYTLEVDSAHKGQYSVSELRTIQDWIVKRQLSGIKGVVEVNTWGGFLKQYEVAINPEKLRSLDISLDEVYEALATNNSVAGGGYIEKEAKSYFIRGEGQLSSLKDIESIVVTRRNHLPILIRDLAKVGFGSANRYGAITGNGEGEKVMGQVMMLKDASTKDVIEAVKTRVAAISKTLPKGVYINPFLERSELIDKTTFTISENLILGCLIVVAVVILLLGNWRSGLVVASIIPLCLLFALSLMYVFGVDANLMSLGAIDFGIIIDGAVIIVEFIAYKITSQQASLAQLHTSEQQPLIDQITLESASKMMRSAVFGQLIIMIVFIPILSLSDVEGKMFRPMALVFCFALIGAMLLCFTYVPVMASLFLKPNANTKPSLSDKFISYLERMYTQTLVWMLRRKAIVLSIAVVLLIGSGIRFSQMGGEFVPTLDEGDFVIQPILKTGTSLGKTVEITTQMEKILLGFKEVKQVVSRIGAAEVPTDPMSMEESDVIIRLAPKSEWEVAATKDDLANRFKEALSIIPGVEIEFTQPIEMRFNELITGVRADLAIKVFGEDLEVLQEKALQIGQAIQSVEGAADISVEKVTGLPQMSVKYRRQQLAKYGLKTAELNRLITTGFSGLQAGVVFEGEKQFDLVLRFDKAKRQKLEDLKNLSVRLPNGSHIPFRELATVEYTKGPAKISRDDTRRRVVIGVNVRNRDLESVVKDVQSIIDTQVQLPAGYLVTYGGQFENLRSARQRLLIAVPIALALIFAMLYFAFHSVKQALMIYSAIPLSAIGGIWLLSFRDLPFSISAGVGFIALFGIAVLNGIVLIEHFNEMKEHGSKNVHRRIIEGGKQRLRPVLLTAMAAALGFLPMAISTSAGAEVQRPLATVVVGGLMTATLLTLIVLPIIYSMLTKEKEGNSNAPKSLATLVAIFFTIGLTTQQSAAQEQQPITMEQAIELALENNKGLQASGKAAESKEALSNYGFDPNPTEVYYHFDQNNIAENGVPLSVIGVGQSFKLPSVYKAEKERRQAQWEVAQQRYALDSQQLAKAVSKAYCQVQYWQAVSQNYQHTDSMYAQFAMVNQRQFEAGESRQLDYLLAKAQQEKMRLAWEQSQQQQRRYLEQLQQWIQQPQMAISIRPLQALPAKIPQSDNALGVQYYQALEKTAQATAVATQKELLPEIQLQGFWGSNTGSNAKGYWGMQIGIGIPLWAKPQKQRIAAAKAAQQQASLQTENYQLQLNSRRKQLMQQQASLKKALDYYQGSGKQLALSIQQNATAAYQNGEIDFSQYTRLQERAQELELAALQQILAWNLGTLDLLYLN